MEESTKKWVAIVVAVVAVMLLPIAYQVGRESLRRDVRESIRSSFPGMATRPATAGERAAVAEPDLAADPPVVTLDEFNQIQTGMSYDQVVGIIGDPGVEQSRMENPGNQQFGIPGTALYSYAWNNGGLGGNCSLQFRDGLVTSKMQFGLR